MLSFVIRRLVYEMPFANRRVALSVFSNRSPYPLYDFPVDWRLGQGVVRPTSVVARRGRRTHCSRCEHGCLGSEDGRHEHSSDNSELWCEHLRGGDRGRITWRALARGFAGYKCALRQQCLRSFNTKHGWRRMSFLTNTHERMEIPYLPIKPE